MLSGIGSPLAQSGKGDATAFEQAASVITEQQQEQLLSSDLIGMEVRDAGGEKVGVLDDILFDENNRIAGGVVAFGGFLGIGRKSIALSWEAFDVRNDGIVLMIDATRRELRAVPAFRARSEVETERAVERARALLREQQMDPVPQSVPPP